MDIQKYYTLKQVAEILQISYSTIRKWVSAGKIQVKRINSRVIRVTQEELDRITKENQE